MESMFKVRWLAQWMAVYLSHFEIAGDKMPRPSCTYPIARPFLGD